MDNYQPADSSATTTKAQGTAVSSQPMSSSNSHGYRNREAGTFGAEKSPFKGDDEDRQKAGGEEGKDF